MKVRRLSDKELKFNIRFNRFFSLLGAVYTIWLYFKMVVLETASFIEGFAMLFFVVATIGCSLMATQDEIMLELRRKKNDHY